MKAPLITAFFCVTVLDLAACGSPVKDTSAATNSNTKNAAPTEDALLALDQQANQAYFKSDSKFFEGILNENFVMRHGGRQIDKAAAVKMIAGNKCDARDWRLEDARMAKIDSDTYVLSYKGTFEASCTAPSGTLTRIPSPIRAVTVWIRRDGSWQAALHGQNLLPDSKNSPFPKPEGKKQQPVQKYDYAAARSTTAPVKPTTDSDTAAMMAAETAIWQYWMAKDVKKLEELTTPDLSFQNIFGMFFANKADTIQNWTGPMCDIKSVSVSDGVGTLLSPTVGMLSRTGTAAGTCSGQELPPVPIYGTSIFVKDGNSWKLAFTLNRLD